MMQHRQSNLVRWWLQEYVLDFKNKKKKKKKFFVYKMSDVFTLANVVIITFRIQLQLGTFVNCKRYLV